MYTINRIKVEHTFIFKTSTKGKALHSESKYKTLYGVSLFQIYILTSYFKNIKHSLNYVNFSAKCPMDIVFKKNYPLRLAAARTLGVGERTFDKYVWYCITLISETIM